MSEIAKEYANEQQLSSTGALRRTCTGCQKCTFIDGATKLRRHGQNTDVHNLYQNCVSSIAGGTYERGILLILPKTLAQIRRRSVSLNSVRLLFAIWLRWAILVSHRCSTIRNPRNTNIPSTRYTRSSARRETNKQSPTIKFFTWCKHSCRCHPSI